MLAFDHHQIRAVARRVELRFEDEMLLHAQAFAPRLCRILGEAQLRIAVRHALAAGRANGFSLRGPLRLCIELMFLCGSGFDTDVQYPALRRALLAGGDQMTRAEAMHEGICEYLEEVSGPANAHVRSALERLSRFARQPLPDPLPRLDEYLLQQMFMLYPEKARHVGADALVALIVQSRNEAQRHRFTGPRAQALVCVLMFAFGHACLRDPLYPWISGTLDDGRIIDAQARAARLERKAITWLDHVLAGHPGSESPA